MSGRRAEIERGLELLRASVVDRLTLSGWTGRDLSDGSYVMTTRSVATATRTAANGVFVAVEIVRTSFTWPPRWPVEVTARIGVGYEPALNLMPLVTLPPRAILVDDREGLVVSLTGPDDVIPAAEQIAGWVEQHADGPVSRFADAAAIDAELERRIDAPPATSVRAKSDGGPKQRPVGVPERLVLLAAMGRRQQAQALLAAHESEARPDRAADPRFIRQLRRWLDRGGPPAPPVEQTLAIVAVPARHPWPPRKQFRATVRARRNVENDARKATRAQADDKDLGQLKALVSAEYGARGIVLPPFAVARYAESLQIERRPFGRVRSRVRSLRFVAGAARESVRMIRGRLPRDPDWLRPPQRASYPVRTDRTHYTVVELDASARSWLVRAQAQAPRRVGPYALLDAWLTRDDPTSPLVVHIGEHRIGIVHSDETDRFDRAMTAAALFDEDPVLEARLAPAADPDSMPLVELALPRGSRTPD